MSGAALRLTMLASMVLLVGVLSLGLGATWIPPRQLWAAAWEADPADAAAQQATILWEVRAPRVLLACWLGAALGCAGTGYQGLFRNALADPFVIGASSGAALGATLAISLGWHGGWWWLDGPSLAALGGAVAVVGLVYALASLGSDTPTLSLLLAGIAVSSFVGAVVSLVMFWRHEQLWAIFGWLMGSLSGRGWTAVFSAVPLIAAGTLGLWCLSRPLDCLAFGEETAASLGWNLSRVRVGVVVAASIATAAAVSAGGIIGFIGLIAPHAARLWMGTSRHAAVLPASFLSGALLLVLADDLARTVVGRGELPVGVITALLGAPFFLVLLRTQRHVLERRA